MNSLFSHSNKCKIFRIYVDHKIIDEKQVIGDMKEWTYQSGMTYIRNRLHSSRMQDMSSFINSQHEGSSFFKKKKKTEWVKIPIQMTPKRNDELNETLILSPFFFIGIYSVSLYLLHSNIHLHNYKK